MQKSHHCQGANAISDRGEICYNFKLKHEVWFEKLKFVKGDNFPFDHVISKLVKAV